MINKKRLLTIPVFLIVLLIVILVPGIESEFIKLFSAMFILSTPLLLVLIWDVNRVILGKSDKKRSQRPGGYKGLRD